MYHTSDVCTVKINVCVVLKKTFILFFYSLATLLVGENLPMEDDVEVCLTLRHARLDLFFSSDLTLSVHGHVFAKLI